MPALDPRPGTTVVRGLYNDSIPPLGIWISSQTGSQKESTASRSFYRSNQQPVLTWESVNINTDLQHVVVNS